MQKQTPKWLDLFLTAFGPSGLVALAWWAGAFHAQRIREWQTTYPILQITGAAAVGKSTLVSNLWKLVGTPEPDHISVNTCSMGSLLAILARAVNRPVVIEESGRPDDCFDWAALRECYAAARWYVVLVTTPWKASISRAPWPSLVGMTRSSTSASSTSICCVSRAPTHT